MCVRRSYGADAAHSAELEFKMGLLMVNIDRLRLGVMSETVLMPVRIARDQRLNDGTSRFFRTALTEEQYNLYKDVLNHHAELHKSTNAHVVYKKTDETDKIYEDQIRMTYSEGRPPRYMRKTPFVDIDVYEPNCPLDFRVSIRNEIPCGAPKDDASPVIERRKERRSYQYAQWSFDLTKVTSTNILNFEPNGGSVVTFELEMEVFNAELIKCLSDPRLFDDLIRASIHNIRALLKYTRESLNSEIDRYRKGVVPLPPPNSAGQRHAKRPDAPA